MAKLLPFKAIRYSEEFDLSDVVCPPYDVISPRERERLKARHEYNFVNLVLPDEGYEAGATNLRNWLGQEVLKQDESESLFVYKAGHTAGLIGLIELSRFGEGTVFPHERTMPGPKADRLEIMRHTEANLEPLWFVTADVDLDSILETDAPPLGEAVDEHDTKHTLSRIDPTEIEVGRLVIADGHHRYETAITYRDERGPGPANLTLAYVTGQGRYAPELRPIHRVVQKAPKMPTGSQRMGNLQELAAEVAHRSAWGLAHEGGYWLCPGEPPKISGEVIYQHDLEEIGDSNAIIMPTVRLSTVIEQALSGGIMPPKTTLFWPKPRSGMVLRMLTQGK